MNSLEFTRSTVGVVLSLTLLAVETSASLPSVAPSKVGISARHLTHIDEAVKESIEKRETPGAVVLVARRGGIVFKKAYGSRAILPQKEEMTVDTIFDVASLTKVVATSTSIMILVERGKIRFSDPISRYIPELKGEGRERITIEHLLTHRSGYAPDFDLREQWQGHDEMLKRLYSEPLRAVPGSRFIYSDIGMIVLGELVHRVSGKRLDAFARENIFEPLGMRDTGFRSSVILDPKISSSNGLFDKRIAPTETVTQIKSYLGGVGDQTMNRDAMLRGQVHDPTSNRMGGVAGHAGVFSTADDLAVFCQMILNGGEYNGVRILSPLGVAEMTRPRQVSDDGQARGIGWDINSSYSVNRGDLFPVGSYGHTGFTGTSFWIDPASESFVVFLSNRVHPNGKGDVASLRGRVASIVASAVTDVASVSRAQLQQSRHLHEVLAGIGRYSFSIHDSRAADAAGVLTPLDAEVLNGVDVLELEGFKALQGLRVGLITNHTGRNRAGKQTVDVLREASGVKLVTLFSPEHGIRGALDEKVSDTVDEKTGLPIYSLYGDTRRPKTEHLKNLDALVFDIQDIGARFYTYISTMGYAMEEAAKAKIPIFVLDRPNPINGVDVEGPVADADRFSFTAYHSIPVRHGMTVGELARLFKETKAPDCDLRVVQMQNWRRAMWLDSTSQVWVNPSPNMRSLTEATLYPGVGLLETTNLSVGRGTDTPFEVVGAPWLDGRKLSTQLNSRNLPGVRFVPVNFTPRASVFKGEECSGINIIVVDRSRFRPVRTGIEIAVALRRFHPSQWKVDDYLRLLVNLDVHERVKRGESAEEIERSWMPRLEEFRRARSRVLLYR